MTAWVVNEVRLHAEPTDWLDIRCREVVEQDHEWGTTVGADGSVGRFVAQQAGLTIKGVDPQFLPLSLNPTDISFTDNRTGKKIRRHVQDCRQDADEIWLAIRGPQPAPGAPGP